MGAERVPLGLLDVETYDVDGCRVIVASGEVDLTTVHLLKTEFDAIEEANRVIVLDLSNVSFIDSTGLHAILEARSAARNTARLFVIDPSPAFSRLVEAARMEAEFEVLGVGAGQRRLERSSVLRSRVLSST